jgi:hypothetical protein
MIGSIFFLMFFMLTVPIAAARLAEDIVEEEIGEPLRAWVEAIYPGSMFAYLVNCSVCMSHWTAGFLTLLCWNQWSQFEFCNGWIVAFICWAAATHIAVRHWLRND